MADNVVDNVVIEIAATTDKAEKSIDKTIESMKALQSALGGVNTKKLKQEMESFEEFQKKLQNAFSNIKVSGNFTELQKQITQAESKLDNLLAKENKLATVSGVDENSKQYRSLQYDIAETCATLDKLYAAMDKAKAQRPLNFWERPDWNATPQPEPTPIEPTIAVEPSRIEQTTSATERLAEAVDHVQQATTPASESMSRLDSVLDKVSGVAQSVRNAFSSFRENLGRGANTNRFNEDMQELIDGINQAKYTMKQMESGNKEFDSTAYETAARELAQATARLQEYKASLTQTTEQTSRFKSVMSGLGSMVRGVFSAMGKVGSGALTAFKAATNAVKSLKNKLPSLGSAFSKLGKKIQSITRLFTFMVLRRAISALLNSVKEGFDTLARYSAAKGTEFNKNISEMQSALKTFGNSIVTAFEPLINAVAPIITAFINKLTQATNAIAQFFAALTGKSVYTKAKKVVKDYAAGLDKATEATKKLASATLGIDELNIISPDKDDDNSGGGGATNPMNAFETANVGDKFKNLADMIKKAWEDSDFSELGRLLAEKINNALESIDWAKIQATARKIALCIGTFINGFVEGLDWTLLGYTIAQGINTALIFANTLLETIDWGLIGRSVATGLNSAINTIDWVGVGKLIYNGFNAAIDLLYDFVSTFDFTKLGESVGTAISTAINGIKWEKGGATVGKAVTGLFKALKGFIDKTDWKSLGTGIVKALGGFFSNVDWSSISGSISSAFKGLCKLLQGAIEGIDWSGLPKYIIESIGDFFKGFDYKGMSESLGSLLGSAVKAAINLVGSIWDMLKEAWGDMTSYFSDYIEEAGGNVIEGIFKGIKDALTNVGTWIKENIFQPFIDGFKEAFGIHSPSKEMATMGGYIVEGFIKGIGDKDNDCMSKVKEWSQNVKDWFYGKGTTLKDKFTEYGGNVIDGFKNKVGNSYTTCREKVSSWTSDLKEYFSGASHGDINKEKWAFYGNEIITGFKDKVSGLYSSCRTSVTAWTDDLKEYFSGSSHGNINKTNWSKYASEVITGFKDKVSDFYTSCRTSITAWTNDLREYFTGSSHGNINKSKWESYANDVISGFKNKIASSYTEARSSMTSFANGVKTWFEKPDGDNKPSLVDKFKDIGKNIIQGFIDGVSSLWDTAMKKIKEFGQSVIAKGKEGTDEHSPSRAFRKIGAYVVEGFNLGIEDESGKTADIMKSWLNFSNMAVNVGTKFNIDDSAFKQYRANLSDDFQSNAIIKSVAEERVNSAVSASFDRTSMTDVLGEVVENTLLPAITSRLDEVARNTKRQADKKEQTVVEIGTKTITDAVREQTSRNGFSFNPA